MSTTHRAQNWQGIMGNQQTILVASPENSIQSVRDINNIMQEQQQQQILSPIRGASILETMTTPMGRHVPVQRCHSVPVHFNSPQGEIYQPRTEIYQPRTEMRGEAVMSPAASHLPCTISNPSFNQLKETRAKFFKNKTQSNARRNLTSSFLNENDVNKTKSFKLTANERKINDETSGNSVNEVKVPERKSILNSDGMPEAIVTPNNAKCYANGLGTRNLLEHHQSTGNGSLSNRKQNGGLSGESSLTSVDTLMDSTFSLAGIDITSGSDNVTSGGNGLNDLDGLDDAETIDLLRSLNSGNNIWVNEWNSAGA